MNEKQLVIKALGKLYHYNMYSLTIKTCLVNECNGFILRADTRVLSKAIDALNTLPDNYYILYVKGFNGLPKANYIYVIYSVDTASTYNCKKALLTFKMQELSNIKKLELGVMRELLQLSKDTLKAKDTK
jgi:hypothetical protein